MGDSHSIREDIEVDELEVRSRDTLEDGVGFYNGQLLLCVSFSCLLSSRIAFVSPLQRPSHTLGPLICNKI
jgi:hypothetical protein